MLLVSHDILDAHHEAGEFSGCARPNLFIDASCRVQSLVGIDRQKSIQVLVPLDGIKEMRNTISASDRQGDTG